MNISIAFTSRHITNFTLLSGLLFAQATLAQPVLITSPATITPTATTITPTAGGSPVPLATAQITVQGTTLTINGRHTIASLMLTSNAIVTHSANSTFDYSGTGTDIVNGLSLSCSGDLVVGSSSRIDVSGAGHPGSTGVGRGNSGAGGCGGGGGGHGGAGGRSNCTNIVGGPSNGSNTQPVTFGSGGGGYPGFTNGGPGGGAIRLIVGGTLTISGSILANGQGPINSSGGAGGSIWISAREVQGSGTIAARGGNEGTTNQSSGGGGGGRIALTNHCVLSPSIVLAVQGGSGADAPRSGTPGTIHISARSIGGCCPADFNGDNTVDFFDYLDFVAAFAIEDPSADFNGDNTIDFFDYLDFVAAFDAECP